MTSRVIPLFGARAFGPNGSPALHSLGKPAARFPAAIATDADLAIAVDRQQTRLAAPLDTVATSMTVENAAIVTAYNLLSIDDEIVQVTGTPAGSTVPISRGFDGTTPAIHLASAIVSGFVDAYHHNTLVAEVEAIEQALGVNLQNVPGSAFFVTSAYDFAPQTPGGNLIVGNNVITLSPVPNGVNGSNTGHYLYISGGTGTPEAVLITGGTAVSGAASGTVIVSCANTHSGAWTIRSATGGMSETINAIPASGGTAIVNHDATVYAAATTKSRLQLIGSGLPRLTKSGTASTGLVFIAGTDVEIANIWFEQLSNSGVGANILELQANASNIHVHNCKFTGTADPVTGMNGGIALAANVLGLSAIEFGPGNYVTGISYGVLWNQGAQDTNGLNVHDNDFIGMGGDGVEINNPVTLNGNTAPRNIMVSGNRFSVTFGNNAASGFGAAFAGATDGVVVGNTFFSCRNQAVHFEVGAQRWVVASNTINGSTGDPGTFSGGIFAFGLNANTFVDYLTVVNNMIENCEVGIYFSYDATHQVRHFQIANNTIRKTVTDAIFFGAAATGRTDGIIASNLVLESGEHGIRIDSVPDNLTVRDNTIANCTGAGMRLNGSGQGTFFDHNILRNNTLATYFISTLAGHPGYTMSGDSGFATAVTPSTPFTTAWTTVIDFVASARGILDVSAKSSNGYAQSTWDVTFDGTGAGTFTVVATSNSVLTALQAQFSGQNLQVRVTDASAGLTVTFSAKFHGTITRR